MNTRELIRTIQKQQKPNLNYHNNQDPNTSPVKEKRKIRFECPSQDHSKNNISKNKQKEIKPPLKNITTDFMEEGGEKLETWGRGTQQVREQRSGEVRL